MDLIQILDRILKTKNKIRDILGESNNISRYPIAIHNAIAIKYNEGYSVGYHDRYFELTDEEVWMNGPEEIYQYGVDDAYYIEYTTAILTDIMRDCLNYRLGMKDSLEIDSDEFVTYPDYLTAKIESVYDIGVADGRDAADADYDGGGEVDEPSIVNDRNKITISTTQSDARIKYKLGNDGIEYEYTTQIIISESCTVYARSILGRSVSDWVSLSCVYDANGFIPFVTPPTIYQEGNLIYLSASTNNTVIEYKIDSRQWSIYNNPISVSTSDSILYCRAIRNSEYSAVLAQPISHASSLTKPANVTCNIEDTGVNRKVTLACATSGATIRYAINDNTGDFFQYSSPFTVNDEHFIIYAYSIKDGERSSTLYWKFDKNETESPQIVYFTDAGLSLIMTCATENAVIYYRFGNVGSFINTNTNNATLSPADGTSIQAYASLNGIASSITEHTFHSQGVNSIEKPYIYKDENNYIIINSSYTILYTTNGNDPKTYGLNYTSPLGPITDTVTIKAVAKDGGLFSDISVYTFSPSNEYSGTGTWEGTGSGIGGKNFFWVSGASEIQWAGTSLYYYDGVQWNNASSISTPIHSSLNAMYLDDVNKKTYFYGNGITKFVPLGKNINISMGGDILSLVKGANFDSVDSYSGNFYRFFENSRVVNAADVVLRLERVSANQYEGMFMNCDRMLSAPQLPATSVGSAAYKEMFSGCSSLVNLPSLPATTLASNCYESMFYGCAAAKTPAQMASAPLMSACYKNMYMNSGLEGKNVPVLPATTLAPSCYEGMFRGTKITDAPELPAENLFGATSCYKEMFYGCGYLGNITAMFTNNPNSGEYTANWVYGVAPYGLFIKNVNATWTGTGNNAVPPGWVIQTRAAVGSVIIEYNPNTSKVRLTASNKNDDIYYWFDDYLLPTSQYTKYTTEFQVKKSGTLYARCYNGVAWGSVSSQLINVTNPSLVITVYNRKVTISAAGFDYDMIKYSLCETQYDIQNLSDSSFSQYNGPFAIDSDWWIVARGYVNGITGYVTETISYCIANISAPNINLYTNANDTRTYVQITYPIAGMDATIYWSVNDSEHISNIYTEPIQVTWYNNELSKVYYAYAQVTYNGQRVNTSVAAREVFKGESGSTVSLSVPGLYQLDSSSNIWYVEYEGTRYTSWDNTSVNIGYRFEIGGSTRVYSNGINLRNVTPLPLTDQIINVYVWAYTDSVNKTEERRYQCMYHADSGATVPNVPTIQFQSTGSQYKVYVSNDTVLGPYDTVVNEYMFEVTEWTADALKNDIKENQWIQISANGDLISNYIVKARFKARTTIWWRSTGSNTSEESEWKEFINDFAVTAIPKPSGEVKKENGVNVLYLYSTMNQSEMYNLQFRIDNTAWASGATDEHKYDDWNELYIYGTPLDTHLGSGHIYLRYSSHGIESDIYEFDFLDPDIVTGLVAPDINVIEKDGRHVVMITNTVNDGVQLFYRVANPTWAGGAVDTNKYNNWKVTFLYGIVLDEYLISGILQARTWDGEEYSDISEYPFSFNYDGIPAPTVSVVATQSGNEILVTSKNKYVTNYWRHESQSTYHVANKYGSTISSSLPSGYLYAYSSLGSDRSSTVSAYYSNEPTTYNPPTISVTPNADGITYSLSMTFDSNPRIFYKIDPTDWDGRAVSMNKYVGTTNTEWLVISKLGNANVATLNLDQYLKGGVISAFNTDATNTIQSNIDNSNNSKVSTYTFINGNYND